MCSGPTIEAKSPDKGKATRTPRVGPAGESLGGLTNDHIRRSDDQKLENEERVGVPGMEAPGLSLDPGAGSRVVSGVGTPLTLGGPTTIGRFALNHTRPTGITALKPGFPRIGR